MPPLEIKPMFLLLSQAWQWNYILTIIPFPSAITPLCINPILYVSKRKEGGGTKKNVFHDEMKGDRSNQLRLCL